MYVVYDNEKKDKTYRTHRVAVHNGIAYIQILFKDNSIMTVVGSKSALDRLNCVLTYEDISVNLDDFKSLYYFEDVGIEEVIKVVWEAFMSLDAKIKIDEDYDDTLVKLYGASNEILNKHIEAFEELSK